MLTLNTRTISLNDKERLTDAVDRALSSWTSYAPYLEFFRRDLRRARPLPPAEVPSDVVTMNSRFVLANPCSREETTYTLVYPQDEDLANGKLSVITPMGMAVHGAHVGDDISWISSDGPEVAVLTRMLYQPEAAGDHHL
jgi:regulator of nucleoside diphosphate kinase